MNMTLKNGIRLTTTILILSIILIGGYEMCRIRTLTHLTHSELEWLTCYHPNDSIFFKNMDGKMDTMTVSEVNVYNSTWPFMNPFLKMEKGPDYIAYACMFFKIQHYRQIYECSFFIYKDSVDSSPTLYWRLGNLVSNGHIRTLQRNCIIGDSLNSHYSNNLYVPNDSINYIESFEWCIKTGLKSFSLINGEVYVMVNHKEK